MTLPTRMFRSSSVQPLEQAAAYLAQYWASVFAEGRSVQAAIDHLLLHVPDGLPDHDWALVVDDFVKALDNYASSAPGPDGIPYAALALLKDEMGKLLYHIYNTLKHKHTNIPPTFNQALMAFLPKGTNATDTTTTTT